MRRKISAGVLMALVLLVPAAPAAAQAEAPGPNAACQTVERKLYKDIRELVTVDLDTANETEIRVVALRILSVARDESLPVLPRAIQERLDGTLEDLRAFLKQGMQNAWTIDLRVSVDQTVSGSGPNVRAAAQKVLDDGTIDAFLAYLNEGLYAARALDCASQPTPTKSPTASPTPTAAPAPASSTSSAASTDAPGGQGGGLPVTGADIETVAGAGGALLLIGGAGYLTARRRRSRFVA